MQVKNLVEFDDDLLLKLVTQATKKNISDITNSIVENKFLDEINDMVSKLIIEKMEKMSVKFEEIVSKKIQNVLENVIHEIVKMKLTNIFIESKQARLAEDIIRKSLEDSFTYGYFKD